MTRGEPPSIPFSAYGNEPGSRVPSQARPLFEDKATLDRFMKLAAPVQSDVSGWQDYLSRRELADYDRARVNMGLGGAAAIGLFLAKTGAVLFLTASVAPAFSLVMGAAAAVAGTSGLASWAKAVRIQKRGERREAEADAEVSARHAKTPQGPRV